MLVTDVNSTSEQGGNSMSSSRTLQDGCMLTCGKLHPPAKRASQHLSLDKLKINNNDLSIIRN